MTKIKILPENLANKIAAGEVVQRPESVVKELLENSIDANAKNITLLIKKAGKTLIQIIDDGEGMSEEDAVLCIQKHATSKIKTYEDLEAISTLGFRGEALSSIAAVSQLEIKTQTGSEELGTIVRVDDNQEIIIEKGSFTKGTSVSVKNIFYNTPARRNFLKSDATELKHIIETFKKIALSYSEINFKFYLDDELIFDYPQCETEERIIQVFGHDIKNAIIPVNEFTDYISVFGYVGKPLLTKKHKGEQYVYLNKRFVISKQINHAVFKAYENVLEKGDYPFFVLFIGIDSRRIDVNVHPSKLEVRFDDDKDVYNFILAVIRKSLASYDLVPSLTFDDRADNIIEPKEKLKLTPIVNTTRNDFSDRPFTNKNNYKPQNFSDKDIELIFGSLGQVVENKQIRSDIDLPFDKEESKSERIIPSDYSTPEEESNFIIQLHNKYILSQIKSGLMIIDQHVAHERILYEKAINLFEANFPFSQQLLFPKSMEVDPGLYQIVKDIDHYLQKLGFELNYKGKNTVIINGVPQDVKTGLEEKILLEIVDEYQSNLKEKNILDEKDNLAKSYSCKTAIKSGDKLTEREMRILIDQLFATTMPYVCPHGRPIVVKISLDEFDRRFGRTS